jgi:hypothetical protein
MSDRGLIVFTIIVWVAVFSLLTESIEVALILTGVLAGVGLVFKSITRVGEDWLEGRELRIQREREEKLKALYRRVDNAKNKIP